MAVTESMVRLEGVRKSFGAVDVLKGVDMTIHAGKVSALVGDNGLFAMLKARRTRTSPNGSRDWFSQRPMVVPPELAVTCNDGSLDRSVVDSWVRKSA